MGTDRAKPVTRALEGEDIATKHWVDARHWMSIYDDLIRFKMGLLDRVQRELPKLHPVAQTAADEDVRFIEAQMAGYYARLDLWYQRVWELQGLWLDPDDRVVRHKGREAVLTHREFELLQFLLDHPHRFYTAVQITGLAWSERRSSQKKSGITCSVCERFSPVWRFPATWSIDPVAAIR